ncbi:hypothetical protein AALP_AAs52786U000400 [Arabis alpina]|uniref:Uncharacterized protein n=1 Tax=Arabis alpina TaxID=50452 RepID=A0A087FZ35_ARAAL|nr:hypothetical protein AALP_AAs52786U000400 [Arabis alpina]
MAKKKVGFPRGRAGGSRADAKDEGKRPATRGGYLKLSKPTGNPTAADGGSPPLSKAVGKRTAADGGSPPLSKADGKHPAAAGAGQDKDAASPTTRVRLNSGQTSLSNSNRQHTTPSQGTATPQGTVSVSRTRDVPLQYPPLSNRPTPPAFRLSPELNLNLILQPGSQEIEMEDEEEEEDEEDDEEGGDDAVEDMEVQYEHMVQQEP